MMAGRSGAEEQSEVRMIRSLEPIACRVCGNLAGNTVYECPEMMFGGGELFPYTECAACGCLQINEIPPDLARFYPADYYSFSGAFTASGKARVVTWLKTRRTSYALTGRGILGRWLSYRWPDERGRTLRLADLRRTDRILDVGCGGGELVYELRSLGYDAVGIDAYIRDDLTIDGTQVLKRASVFEESRKFDVVMMHHSFEHMAEPGNVLAQCGRFLAPGGRILIHIPTAASWVWRHYRTNWVGLDAPRHLFLHTPNSMAKLTEVAGLRVTRMLYTSGGGQFWQCEQRAKGLALRNHVPYHSAPISRAQRRKDEARAQELNRQNDGDQVAFVLERA